MGLKLLGLNMFDNGNIFNRDAESEILKLIPTTIGCKKFMSLVRGSNACIKSNIYDTLNITIPISNINIVGVYTGSSNNYRPLYHSFEIEYSGDLNKDLLFILSRGFFGVFYVIDKENNKYFFTIGYQIDGIDVYNLGDVLIRSSTNNFIFHDGVKCTSYGLLVAPDDDPSFLFFDNLDKLNSTSLETITIDEIFNELTHHTQPYILGCYHSDLGHFESIGFEFGRILDLFIENNIKSMLFYVMNIQTKEIKTYYLNIN